MRLLLPEMAAKRLPRAPPGLFSLGGITVCAQLNKCRASRDWARFCRRRTSRCRSSRSRFRFYRINLGIDLLAFACGKGSVAFTFKAFAFWVGRGNFVVTLLRRDQFAIALAAGLIALEPIDAANNRCEKCKSAKNKARDF